MRPMAMITIERGDSICVRWSSDREIAVTVNGESVLFVARGKARELAEALIAEDEAAKREAAAATATR